MSLARAPDFSGDVIQMPSHVRQSSRPVVDDTDDLIDGEPPLPDLLPLRRFTPVRAGSLRKC